MWEAQSAFHIRVAHWRVAQISPLYKSKMGCPRSPDFGDLGGKIAPPLQSTLSPAPHASSVLRLSVNERVIANSPIDYRVEWELACSSSIRSRRRPTLLAKAGHPSSKRGAHRVGSFTRMQPKAITVARRRLWCGRIFLLRNSTAMSSKMAILEVLIRGGLYPPVRERNAAPPVRIPARLALALRTVRAPSPVRPEPRVTAAHRLLGNYLDFTAAEP
jgi:hypothetical protein